MPDSVNDTFDFYQKLAETSQSGVYIFSIETGQNIYSNSRCTEILGYSRDALQAMSPQEFSQLFHPEDLARVETHMNAVLSQPDDRARSIKYRFRHKNGTWVSCFSRDAPFRRNVDGKVVEYLGSFVDFSDREIEAHRADLTSTAIGEANSVIRMLAHDLKTPLVTIGGYIGLLRKHLSGGDDRKAIELAEKIATASNAMGELIETIRETGEISDPALEIKRVPFEFGDAVGSLLGLLRPQITAAEASLVCDTPLMRLSADRGKVGRALINLVENALFHGCAAPGQTIHVGARDEGGAAVIFVRDTGPGVSEADQRRIFRAFHVGQGDRSHGRSGLGLAIIDRIARQHGGESGVISTPGQGAEFWLSLGPGSFAGEAHPSP